MHIGTKDSEKGSRVFWCFKIRGPLRVLWDRKLQILWHLLLRHSDIMNMILKHPDWRYTFKDRSAVAPKVQRYSRRDFSTIWHPQIPSKTSLVSPGRSYRKLFPIPGHHSNSIEVQTKLPPLQYAKRIKQLTNGTNNMFTTKIFRCSSFFSHKPFFGLDRRLF